MALKKKPVMWTLEEGRAEVEKVQEGSREFGYHVALGGGVLNGGESRKDLDLYFLPLDNDNPVDSPGLITWLATIWGVGEPMDDPAYGDSPHWRAKLKYFSNDKRIDVFIGGVYIGKARRY